MAAAYPAKARGGKLLGHVTMSCGFQKDGRLKDCRVLLEEPKGQGFAGAARTLTPLFLGPTSLAPGVSTEGMDTQIAFSFTAEMASGGAPVIGYPKWTQLPTGEQTAAALPKMSGGPEAITLRARLDCLVVAGGKVDDCKVDSETPAGQGFGGTALAMSKYFEMTVWTAEGLPTVGGRVRIPLRYDVPAASPAPKP